jgi:hypothetical protein
MKKCFLLMLTFLATAGFAAAQTYGTAGPTSDVLGAHLNYGRGCAACHAPHSGAFGNGNAKTADPTSGNVALWGEDVSSLYNKTITSGSTDGSTGFVETLPGSFTAASPDVGGLLTCLSCHDGNYATGAMMKNAVYETLPSTYGKQNTIPTLLGNDGTTGGNYLNDHPVGLSAVIGCTATSGSPYDWDCTSAGGTITMNGPNSSAFVKNYGYFVSPKAWNNQPTVMCTTCHNQHLMNVVKVTNGPKSGLPSGNYATMFFIRAPYNPSSGTAGSNQTAQFCRQCHGGEANESNGANLPTIF